MKGMGAILVVLALLVGAVALSGSGGDRATTRGDATTTNHGGSPPRACERRAGVIRVGISSTRYPAVLVHIDRAVARGWPRVLTITRAGAGERREQLLNGIPTHPGHDRDEWPMAFARRSYHADVAYVPSGQNRGSGAVIGLKLRRYCDGQRFEIVGY